MAKYIYPAIFEEEKDGGFFISFPDIQGCFTQGENLQDGFEMAKDALSLMLVHLEDEKKKIPAPTSINDIKVSKKSFVSYIECDTKSYRRLMLNNSVKKTLTIPAWLNESAIKAGINFSQVLTNALQKELEIA